MWRRILNGQVNTITSAAIIIATATLASRFLGLWRDRILASQFGAGPDLDIYYASFQIPNFLYNLLILGTLSVAFLPVFTTYWQKGNQEAAWQLTNSILNLLFLVFGTACLLLIIFTPGLVPLIAPGFSGAQKSLTRAVSRLMMLSPLFFAFSSLFSSVLSALRRFVVVSLAPIFYNLSIIFAAIFLVPLWGIYGLAGGVVIGSLLHFVLQIPFVQGLGWRYQAKIWWQLTGLKETALLFFPRIFTIDISQVSLLIGTLIGSTLVAGSISVFNLANNLQALPLGLFAVSYAVAAFPTLAGQVAQNKKEELVKIFSQTTRQILFFIIPTTFLLIILRAQIVRVVLGAGKFDWTDTFLTLQTLGWFAVSLFAQSLVPLLARTFYALHDTLTPVLIMLVVLLFHIPLSFWLAGFLGAPGLALAFSLSSILNFSLLWLWLHRKLGSLQELKIIKSVFKISLAALLMGVLTQFIKTWLGLMFGTTTLWRVLLQGGLAGILGLFIYLVLCAVLQSEEFWAFWTSLKRRLWKESEPRKQVVVEEEGI